MICLIIYSDMEVFSSFSSNPSTIEDIPELCCAATMEGKDEDSSKKKEQMDINDDDKSDYETASEDETPSDDSEDDTTTISSEDDTTPLLGTKKKKRKKPKRCQHPSCRTKLLLTSYSCYCGLYFCTLHTPPEEHSCDFDYKAMARKKIKEDNPKCVKERVVKFWDVRDFGFIFDLYKVF